MTDQQSSYFPERVRRLVGRFESSRTQPSQTRLGLHSVEAQLRNDYLDTFFESLGWDMRNERSARAEVLVEDVIPYTRRKVDYCFRVDGHRKFYVEAKRGTADVESDACFEQVLDYAFDGEVRLVILTNFESFIIYGWSWSATGRKKAHFVRLGQLTYREYERAWPQLASLFSREAVARGSMDYLIARIARNGRDFNIFAEPPWTPPMATSYPVQGATSSAPWTASAPPAATTPPAWSPESTNQAYPAPCAPLTMGQRAATSPGSIAPIVVGAGILGLLILAGGGLAFWALSSNDTASASSPAPEAHTPARAAAGLAAQTPGPAITARRSLPPTVLEWGTVTREVNVRGSTDLNCETKMFREWLRVTCHGRNNTGGTPTTVDVTTGRDGNTYTLASRGLTSLVLPFVEGIRVEALFSWTDESHKLVVAWPSGEPQPEVKAYFE